MTLLTVVGVGVFSIAMTWMVYGFRFSMAADPSVKFDRAPLVQQANLIASHNTLSPQQALSQPLPLMGRAILWMDDHRLLPDAWLHGLFYTWMTSLYRSEYLLGRVSLTGWWYYFPLAMLFKTPFAILIAIGILAARFLARVIRARQLKSPTWDAICLWLAIVVYGAVAMRTNLNLGLRHILPLYPFIYILIAITLASAARHGLKTRATWIAIVLVGATALETLANWPHEISFFNIACDGPQTKLKLLSDSNLDWGQDLPLLAEWQQQHSDRPALSRVLWLGRSAFLWHRLHTGGRRISL